MTTKFLTTKLALFKLSLSSCFPRKAASQDNFLLSPPCLTPLQHAMVFAYCRLVGSDFLRKSAVSCVWIRTLEFPGEGVNLRQSVVFCEKSAF